MRNECYSFHGNKQKICNGDSDLPKWKIDSYRISWGLEPIFGSEKPQPRESNPSFVKNEKNIGYGPGSELIRIYEEAGVPSCSECYRLAAKMNAWGVDGCLKRLDKIIEDILPRAKYWVAENKPWVNAILPNAVKEAAIVIKLRSDILKAIESAGEPSKGASASQLNQNPKLPMGGKSRNTPASGCGCGP